MTESEFLDKIEKIFPLMTFKSDGDDFGAYWSWYEYDNDGLYVKISDMFAGAIIRRNGVPLTIPQRVQEAIAVRHHKYLNSVKLKKIELDNQIFISQIENWS